MQNNDTAIFQVISNLNHDGVQFSPGQFIEANNSAFEDLVKDGVLHVVAGASSIEEAKEIVAKEKSEVGEADKVVEKEPQNTWGPQPDEQEDKIVEQNKDANIGTSTDAVNPEDKKPEEYTGPIGKYKITGLAEYTDEHGVKTGDLPVGSIQNLPKEIGDVLVGQGVAEEVTDASGEVGPDAKPPEAGKITGDNL